MYQPRPTTKDRIATIIAVLAMHAMLAFALINISPDAREQLPPEVIEIFDVTEAPPPEPPVVEQLPEPEQEPQPREEGAASAPNIESRATPVVAPRPPISLPIPQPMPVTQTPGEGSESTQGAAPIAGPGTGAGGVGTGTGSGGAGSGTGGGGAGGGTRPSLLRGVTNRDFPEAIQRRWPRGGRIFVRVRVEPNGRPSQCDVLRSFGDAASDQWTCSLVMSRATFRPATDANGRPISAWFGYVQSDTGRFDR
ncbi:energy transducer TonB [Sphingomonas xanthus]|uniref:Energy transducer TonB n=1 Tax=Sphingomonas xanthus TaxID=2594473 RepID=A0A516ISR2_9SPHN|nr:energy transducer TonB [Sphingomonas xanthus]QDP19874.1 energy transducer TonB [Sphingomonas xanthus]